MRSEATLMLQTITVMLLAIVALIATTESKAMCFDRVADEACLRMGYAGGHTHVAMQSYFCEVGDGSVYEHIYTQRQIGRCG